MATAVMTRQDALGWVRWAASHRRAQFMCSLSIDQYKEGAELATARAMALERGPHAKYNKRLIAEHARRARNNIGLVVALDTLGFDTAGEAAAALADELQLGASLV